MSADNLKWRINRAIRTSNLPSNARLIMWTLSDMADAKTGEIPEKKAPSIRQLTEETDLGESTVRAALTILEELGWVVRSRPDAQQQARHISTGYRLQVGAAGEKRAPAKRKPKTKKESNKEASGVQDVDPAGVQELDPENETGVQEMGFRGPGDGVSGSNSCTPLIKDDDRNDRYDRVAADAAPHAPSAQPSDAAPRASPKPETENQRANRLAKIYTDRVKLSNFMAVRGVVVKAIRADCTDQQIADGLNRLIAEQRGVSADTLRIAIVGAPRANNHQPYQRQTDPNAYSGGIQ